MFYPDEIIFAPTARCNLSCAHCRVNRVSDELPAEAAIAFLRDAVAHGIERIGFSGGEPFLRPDFLCAVSREALDLGLYFDRLMTNGVWFSDVEHLNTTLQCLFDSGFDGTFGLSVDSYHGQTTEKLFAFMGSVFRIWGRKDCIEILSVASDDDTWLAASLSSLSAALDGTLIQEDGQASAIQNDRYAESAKTGEDDREALNIRIARFPRSASSDEDAWNDESWFTDDRCAGPGNAFYVHPDGSVAVCCGFANENENLKIGNIHTDGCESLLANAKSNAFVQTCFETGLGARRKEMEQAGARFPGKTRDICFFCDYLYNTDKRT